MGKLSNTSECGNSHSSGSFCSAMLMEAGKKGKYLQTAADGRKMHWVFQAKVTIEINIYFYGTLYIYSKCLQLICYVTSKVS